MIKSRSSSLVQVPLKIAGSNHYGRYPKISSEQTFNMIVSDGWLVDYAGYINTNTLAGQQGRGLYFSQNYGQLIAVVDNNVYSITLDSLLFAKIGTLATFTGDVFIAENNGHQIALCDKLNIYIFNYATNVFQTINTDFLPGYIAFQDGYFISVALNTPKWRLSAPNDGTSWDAADTGIISTKSTMCLAAVPFPGKQGLLAVFGGNVGEVWRNNPTYSLFPYQRSNFNYDQGLANAASIAFNEEFIAWVATNEKSGVVILYSNGGNAQKISNDGLDYELSQLTNPNNCYAFFIRQEGHLFYQVTFPDDEVTYAFDFNTNPIEFYTLTDQHMNNHIAKRVVFANNTNYFISFVDGGLYELNTKYTTFDGMQIPRVRVCNTIRKADGSAFIINNLTFIVEQGTSSDIPRIDMSVSKNGGVSFSNYTSRILNAQAHFKNRLNFWNLGYCNELTVQLRFWGNGRFVATDGMASYYQ